MQHLPRFASPQTAANFGTAQNEEEIVYPESDGKPMAETELHQDWMVRIRDILRWRYRKRRAYVGCNLLVYFERGDTSRSVAPDCFVTLDCERGRRRIYKTWEEGKPPDVVIEVTSSSTRREDEVRKREIYTAIGMSEYFLYDPTSDYLDPPLQGWRLKGGKYRRITGDESGALLSLMLNIRLSLHESDLVLHDAKTGKTLLPQAEVKERQARESDAKRKRADAARRLADARAAAEIARREAAEARQAAEIAARGCRGANRQGKGGGRCADCRA